MRIGQRIVARKTLLWYGALVIAVAAVAAFGLESVYGTSSASPSTARTVTVERGTVESSVSASGNVSAATSDAVDFQTSGTLTAVDVTVGQTVTAGQVLGTLDATDAQAALASAQATLSAAEYTLSSAEQGGTPAQLKQDQATMTSAENQLTSEQEQLTTDETNLTDAQNQLAADQALGCPASSSSGSTGSGGSGISAQDATVTTGSASTPSDTSVTFSGTVDPGGTGTYYFEYGISTAYGSQTPTTNVPSGSPSASSPVSVSATVTGLTPDTTYLYALVVDAQGSTTVGVPETVKTPSSACVVDQQTITTDQQTVAKDQASIQAQQMTIAANAAAEAVVPSTISQDQAQVLQDENTVTADQKALNETTLTAPVSGTVTAVNGTVGETVSGGGTSASDAASSSSGSASSGSASSGSSSSGFGASGSSSAGSSGGSSSAGSSSSGSSSSGSSSSSAFVTIEDLGSLQVVAGFAEADIAKMAPGETATATLPALPDTDVTGTVTAVSPTSTVVSNVVTYDVTIALQNPPSSVKVGMTADVSVVVQTATDTVELPSAAITTTGPISTVTVLSNGKKTVTRVTTGLVGDSTTQILSGVTVGQVVVEPVASVSAASTTGTGITGGLGSGLGGGGFGGFGSAGGVFRSAG